MRVNSRDRLHATLAYVPTVAAAMEVHRVSPFIEAASVEAWDAWFRWRNGTSLHDISIEDTWQRVATALAAAEESDVASLWASRFNEALAGWRVLPDERLLASAGTRRIGWKRGDLCASLNAAAFVFAAGTVHAHIDRNAVLECARLAVRMLDNAYRIAGLAAPRIRVGLIGMADALLLLGLDYDSEGGRSEAGAFSAALCKGCMYGSVQLARDRGPAPADPGAAIARAMRRGDDRNLLRDARRHGLRYLELTSITSQRRLALLANDVSDALDPLREDNHVHYIDAPGGERVLHSSGYALNVLRAGGRCDAVHLETSTMLPWQAQVTMRAAVQPWMDEPISYPFLLRGMPGAPQRREAARLGAMHGLGKPAWRIPDAKHPPRSPQRRGQHP
ncbi:MAG TPA: hypothetical protein VFY97_01530 [Rhodanobacteraceae bacterium]|nr:hypothetical protein [Rhodanobacteraceae bacterium]